MRRRVSPGRVSSVERRRGGLTWRKVPRTGLLDFIPLMRISYDWVPSRLFGLLGYQMFAFLFSWTDANWVRPRPPSPSLLLPPALRLSLRAPAPAHDALTRPLAPRTQLLDRKAKMFCFMPSPVSSASIFWWTGYAGFSTCVLALSLSLPLSARARERVADVGEACRRGCVLDDTADKWFDKRFPPLAIHQCVPLSPPRSPARLAPPLTRQRPPTRSGGKDYLVLTEPLLKRLREQETDVQLIRVQKLDDGEHCDFFWCVSRSLSPWLSAPRSS